MQNAPDSIPSGLPLPEHGYESALGHYEAGRLNAAAEVLRDFLAVSPDHLPGLNLRAIIAIRAGNGAEAEAALQRIIALHPGYFDAYNNLGVLLQNTGRLEEAEAAFRTAIGINPGDPSARCNLGHLLQATGRLDEAESAYWLAIRLKPDYAEAHCNLGTLLRLTQRWEYAETAFRVALRIDPDHGDASHGLAAILAETGRPDEAEAAYRLALQIAPDYANGYNNYGGLLQELGRYEEAEAAYRTALRIDPRHAGAHLNLGVVLSTFGFLAEAEAECRTVLDIEPGFADAHVLWALMDLLRGDFASGWARYERRWQGVFKSVKRHYAQPEWDGRPFPGRTLLIHGEQGLGDKIQFVRYVPLLARMGGRVVLECAPPLYRLFGTVAGVAELVREGDPLPDFDLHCSMLSLPFLLETRLDTIPAEVPYLAAPTEGPELPARPGAPFKVGLHWAGNAEHKNDRFRSLPFDVLEPLFAVPGITWAILQKERRPEGFDALARERGWLDPMAGAGDFADTAALVGQLDLVIGADTAVIHLAGALGKPGWVLLPAVPDWRWLLEREDSPWYPGLRLFRQKTMNDWPELIGRVAEALAARAAAAPANRESA